MAYIILTVVPDKKGERVTRGDNPFTVLNRDRRAQKVLPGTVQGTWSINDMVGLVIIRNDSASDNSNGRQGNNGNGLKSDVSYNSRRIRSFTSLVDLHIDEVLESGRRHLHGGIMGKSTDGGLSGCSPPRRDIFVDSLF